MIILWTLSQAIDWIVTRSEEVVADAPRSVIELSLAETGSAEFLKAKRELWGALHTGRLKADGLGADMKPSSIEPAMWRHLGAFLEHGVTGWVEELRRPYTPPGSGFTSVAVDAAAVKKLWKFTSVRMKPGPKRKVDYEAFEKEVHSWIAYYGLPDPSVDPGQRQADLERHMMEWHHDTCSEAHNRRLVVRAIQTYKAQIPNSPNMSLKER